MTSSQPKNYPPIKYFKRLTGLLLFTIVVLAITAGYYHQLHQLELKRYNKIEDQFVRLRSQLGTVKTNQLIKDSYLETVPSTAN